ncbi:hypothetical protein KKF84_21585 [Myxococcota bacterium]|nr:hypothetical protein [Myxococcota bacterium]MBU1537919.1 hypothetical protein [Myxococcota bacterium]
MKRFSIVLLTIFSFLALSCSENEGDPGNSSLTKAADKTTVNLDFPQDNTEEYIAPTCGPTTYPCPPYGLKTYQIVENFPLIPVGESAELIADESGIAWMKDLHKYKEQGFKLILLTISAGWCYWCGVQADVLASSIADTYADKVLFLTAVVQDQNGYDSGATYAEIYMNQKNLDGFDNVFLTYDPEYLFQRYMSIAAFPFNAWINLETMELMGEDSALADVNTFTTAITEKLAIVR